MTTLKSDNLGGKEYRMGAVPNIEEGKDVQIFTKGQFHLTMTMFLTGALLLHATRGSQP